MSAVTVVGSYVVDLMCRTPHMPKPGETVLGGPFRMGPGGKGGNQAVAAARLGAKVTMVTKVGNDDFGQAAIENFLKEGIDTRFVYKDEHESTGAALIVVDRFSENMIVVALGACGCISSVDVQSAEKEIAASDVVLVQLETNMEAVEATVKLANRHQVPVILNPAPFQELPKKILKGVAFATPNETEASLLSGIRVVDEHSALAAAKKIYQMGVKTVVITLGKKGCFLYTGGEQGQLIAGFDVEAVDSTGAGDAFNGGFAHALAGKKSLHEAVSYANAVAALSVTKVGTAPSMPFKEEVEAFYAGKN